MPHRVEKKGIATRTCTGMHASRISYLKCACTGDADAGEVAARIYKVAKIVADTKEENMSLYKKGTKKLPQSEWCQPLTDPEANVRWSDYSFHPYQKKQINRIVDGRGATQTRLELANGSLEETMYKQVMSNDGVKDFQDKIATGLLARTGSIPEPIRDAKGTPRTGLPRPPHALERPERAMMSIQKAATQVGITLAAMPIAKVNEWYTCMMKRDEMMDRTIRVVLNESYTQVLKLMQAFSSEDCRCTSCDRCNDTDKQEAALTAIEQTHEIVIEAVTQMKIAVNGELMRGLGLNVARADAVTEQNMFDNAMVRETDPDDKNAVKALRKHMQEGIAPKVSNRPAGRPSAGQQKDAQGKPRGAPKTPKVRQVQNDKAAHANGGPGNGQPKGKGDRRGNGHGGGKPGGGAARKVTYVPKTPATRNTDNDQGDAAGNE